MRGAVVLLLGECHETNYVRLRVRHTTTHTYTHTHAHTHKSTRLQGNACLWGCLCTYATYEKSEILCNIYTYFFTHDIWHNEVEATEENPIRLEHRLRFATILFFSLIFCLTYKCGNFYTRTIS